MTTTGVTEAKIPSWTKLETRTDPTTSPSAAPRHQHPVVVKSTGVAGTGGILRAQPKYSGRPSQSQPTTPTTTSTTSRCTNTYDDWDDDDDDAVEKDDDDDNNAAVRSIVVERPRRIPTRPAAVATKDDTIKTTAQN